MKRVFVVKFNAGIGVVGVKKAEKFVGLGWVHFESFFPTSGCVFVFFVIIVLGIPNDESSLIGGRTVV